MLSDDGELIAELIQTGFVGMRFPVFLLQLIPGGLIMKNVVGKCLWFWEQGGQFKKKEIGRWRKELQQVK